jgi:O-antigen/teichoic acid export membrane protein
VAGLAMGPFLFDGFLAGRYQPAAEILPLGMTLACWSGLGAVATAYMLCAEKGRQNAILTGICLLVNLLLNYPLILWMGLFGAALATTISNGVLLYLILWRLDNDGCSIRRQTYLISCLPVCLSLGPTAVTCLLVALTFVCGRTNWLLTERDRASIDELLIPYCRRVRLPIGSLWPARASTG